MSDVERMSERGADANVDIDNVKEAVSARRKLQEGRRMLVLVDNRKVWQVTKDAQAYSASKEVGELSRAMAILSGSSLPARLIANFFIRFNKVHSPTKMFKSERSAIKWLESYK